MKLESGLNGRAEDQVLSSPIIAQLEMQSKTSIVGDSSWYYVTSPTNIFIRDDVMQILSAGLLNARAFPKSPVVASPGFCPEEVLPEATLSTGQMGLIQASLLSRINGKDTSMIAWYGQYDKDPTLHSSLPSFRQSDTIAQMASRDFEYFVFSDGSYKSNGIGNILMSSVAWTTLLLSLDLSTIYSTEDEIDCIDGKLDMSRWIERVDNQSKLNDDENKITFENLWNVIFLMAHNQLVDKHRNRFPSLSAVELYRWARERNVAQYQAILFYDWLPKFTGLINYNKVVGKYKGFQKNENPQVSLNFVLSFSLFTKATTSIPMEFGNDIGEMLLEASALPFKPDSNFIHNIDTEHLTSLLRKTRSIGILPYQEICKKNTYSCPTNLEDSELHREVYKLYSKEKKGLDFLVGILLNAADFSHSDKTWKYVLLEQFKKLRDGDSMWYESLESEEIISQLSETSVLGFLRNTLKEKHLKVGFYL
eukprot:g10733.t1